MKQKRISAIDLLQEKYPQYSTKELYSFIMCGEVKIKDETIKDKNYKVSPLEDIIIIKKKWVSRGGEKLEHILKKWNINCLNKLVLDAGSSTGGFTDAVISYGAKRVYAVDVGYNQLCYSLRIDPRVEVMEKTNIMSVTNLEPAPDFAVADLSFRSLKGAAVHILNLTRENALYALIKPQFEIKKTKNFNGIIRDKAILFDVLFSLAETLEKEGVKIEALTTSPIKGAKGNVEFLSKLSIEQQNKNFSNEQAIKKFFNKEEKIIEGLLM